MPASLVLEALCQAGSYLILESTDRELRAVLLSVAQVAFGPLPEPGDELVVEGRISSLSSEAALFSGRVLVEGRTVLEAEDILCGLMAADRLEPSSVTGARLDLMRRRVTA